MFIDFEGIINVRDLGGMATRQGTVVKSGKLLRTAKLDRATQSDIRRLSNEYSLAHIFDFRDDGEAQRQPDREVPGAKYNFCRVLPELPASKEEFDKLRPQRAREIFEDMYVLFARHEHCINAYRNFLRTVIDSKGKTVLWHCTQGKDRTGIGTILLLTALGVEEKDIMEDYYLSNGPMEEEYRRFCAVVSDAERQEVVEILSFVKPEYIQRFLDAVQEDCGGVEGYLRQKIGLRDEDFAALREYYTE